VKTDLSGNGAASATLVDTTNGWQVQTPPPTSTPIGSQPATPANGKIVQ
jgi:hypothetical protein